MGERSSNIARTRQAELKQQPQQQSHDALFDTHPEVSLDFEIVRQAARQKYTRPFLILDTAIVREKIRRWRGVLPRVRPHYAVKANPDRRVLKVLVQEGAGFEIASTSELDLLLGLGVPAAEVFFSNPMKSRDTIAYAASKGVRWFVVDSVDELRRMHGVDPGAHLYLRIATPNIGSDWPLSGKFGAGAHRVGEKHFARIHAQGDQQVELRGRSDLEARALLHQRLQHAPVGIGLHRVMRSHARHRRAEAAQFLAHDGGIDDQEGPRVLLACGLAHDLEVEADFGMRVEELFLRKRGLLSVACEATGAFAHQSSPGIL